MKLDPFHIYSSQVSNLTPKQMEIAAHRIACNFGSRAEYSPLSYIALMIIMTIGTEQAMTFFLHYWPLELALSVISVWRFVITKKLARSDEQHYSPYLQTYYVLSLLTGLLWGVINAMMIWFDQMGNFSYLVLSLTIATTGGSIGTMASYFRVGCQYILLKWLPILLVLSMLALSGISNAFWVGFMVLIMLTFFYFQSRRIAIDYQVGLLQQIQLESRGDELTLALKTIEQQQNEVMQHRDHLQELVDEQTEDLILAKEKAEQADKSKSEFLANMSHELRTPLHSILSFSHFGLTRLGKVDEEKIRDYLEKINYSGEIQLSLVNNLLDLSRLESKKDELNLNQHNLLDLLHSVMSELSSLYEQKQLALLVDDPMAIVYVNVDGDKIKQLLRNLLGNAIKFAPEKSQIHIRVFQTSGVVRLEIEDQGPGVPEEDKEAIFDKFNQSSRTRNGSGGTGLGLAICSQIMRLHKGDIWVEDAANCKENSNQKTGSVFIVVFPCQ